METIHTIEWMKQVARQARAEGRLLGLVPTMGALHEGHLSLVRAAKLACSPVVVSIFVNPKQFGPGEDLGKYPRRVKLDRALLESLDVDYLFAPGPEEIYPPGFCTHVEVDGLSARLEGRSRPGHFRGMATVVLKLLEIAQPHAAFFGRKDAQQARIIRRLVSDLNLDVRVEVCPIVREADGLAMSSRNAYLSAPERRAATSLFRALDEARREIERGQRSVALLLASIRGVFEAEPLATVDYAEIVNADSFEPIPHLAGACLAAIAVIIGSTRLIDNMLIQEKGGGFRMNL
jgi:pantoate--beta-alanine ligase